MWILQQKIGSGAWGEVFLLRDTATKQLAAKKIVPKRKLKTAEAMHRILTEIKVLKSLEKHPNITELYWTEETSFSFEITMEYAEGGNLLEYLNELGRRITEDIVRGLFSQIVRSVMYLHRKGFIHRDIKAENILLSADKRNIKLADFGFATSWKEGHPQSLHYGSTYYSSPEIINKTFYEGPEADVWSLGVLLYAMISTRYPFEGKTSDEIQLSILNDPVDFAKVESGPYGRPVSAELREIVLALLEKRTLKRIKLRELLFKPWFSFRNPHLLSVSPSSSSSPSPSSSSCSSPSSSPNPNQLHLTNFMYFHNINNNLNMNNNNNNDTMNK